MTSFAARSSSTRPAPSSTSPQSPSSKTSPAASPKTVSPSDELHSLQAALADLQSKRLNALKLYQEEKARRVAEAARAAELAAQLESLASARQPKGKKGKGPTNRDEPSSIITTDFFIAEVRSLGLAQGGPSASLTWHCLAMTDLLASPPKFVIVADPSSRVESPRMSGRHRTHSSQNERIPRAERVSNDRVTEPHVDELAALNERLRQAEEAAAAAKLSQQRNEHLIADLKDQLDASTAACKDLLDTVKEQEDTIEKLS